MRTKRTGISALGLLIGLLAARAGDAATVHWQLGGTIERIGVSTGAAFTEEDKATFLAGLGAHGISEGSLWSGQLSFDSDALASSGDPSHFAFAAPAVALTFSSGDLTVSSVPGFPAPTADLYPGTPLGDWLVFGASIPTSSLAALQLQGESLGLVAATSGVFRANALPANAPVLTDLVPPTLDCCGAMVGTHFGLQGLEYLPGVAFPALFEIDGRITHLELVPEPEVGSLLATLLVMVGASAAPTSSSRRGAAWWRARAGRGPA